MFVSTLQVFRMQKRFSGNTLALNCTVLENIKELLYCLCWRIGKENSLNEKLLDLFMAMEFFVFL